MKAFRSWTLLPALLLVALMIPLFSPVLGAVSTTLLPFVLFDPLVPLLGFASMFVELVGWQVFCLALAMALCMWLSRFWPREASADPGLQRLMPLYNRRMRIST